MVIEKLNGRLEDEDARIQIVALGRREFVLVASRAGVACEKVLCWLWSFVRLRRAFFCEIAVLLKSDGGVVEDV